MGSIETTAPDLGPMTWVGKGKKRRPLPLRVARDQAIIEDAADPDNPRRTIRRTRVVCLYDQLWRRGGLADGDREAADLYAVLCDVENGARDRGEAGMLVRRPPWQQGHPSLTQVQAAAKLRHAHEVVGADAAALLRLYVRDNLDFAEIARRRGRPGRGSTEKAKDRHRAECERDVKGRTLAAITRLAELWGM